MSTKNQGGAPRRGDAPARTFVKNYTDLIEDYIATDAHDKLAETYLKYFKSIERYEKYRNQANAAKCIRDLGRISKLCIERRKEVKKDANLIPRRQMLAYKIHTLEDPDNKK